MHNKLERRATQSSTYKGLGRDCEVGVRYQRALSPWSLMMMTKRLKKLFASLVVNVSVITVQE